MQQNVLPAEKKSENLAVHVLGNVRSRRSHLTSTSKTCGHSVPSAVKNQRSRLSTIRSSRITPRHPLSQSQRAIASAERWPSQAIPIVRDSDLPEFLDRMRQRRWALVPLAIEAVRYTLEVKKDARLAIKILRDLGIPPERGSEPELPQRVTGEESEEDLQVRAIANFLMKEFEAKAG